MTRGVVRLRKTTINTTVTYPRDGGSTRLELTPGGGLSAGVRLGSEVMVAMRLRIFSIVHSSDARRNERRPEVSFTRTKSEEN